MYTDRCGDEVCVAGPHGSVHQPEHRLSLTLGLPVEVTAELSGSILFKLRYGFVCNLDFEVDVIVQRDGVAVMVHELDSDASRFLPARHLQLAGSPSGISVIAGDGPSAQDEVHAFDLFGVVLLRLGRAVSASREGHRAGKP